MRVLKNKGRTYHGVVIAIHSDEEQPRGASAPIVRGQGHASCKAPGCFPEFRARRTNIAYAALGATAEEQTFTRSALCMQAVCREPKSLVEGSRS